MVESTLPIPLLPHSLTAMSKRSPSGAPASTPASRAPSTAPTHFREVRTPRTFEGVVAQVRELLLGGSLKPGDRLPPERELAVQLGIGRSALREALRAMEVGGLVVLKKGKAGGAFISSGSPSVVSDSMSDMLRLSSVTVEDLFEMRSWIQAGLVRAACQRGTTEQFERMRASVAETKRLHEMGNAMRRRLVGVEFHNILAEATCNPVAMMVMRALTDSMTYLSTDLGSYPIPSYFRDRLRLVDALAARDEQAAEKAMTRILKGTLQLYRRLEVRRDVDSPRKPAVRARAIDPRKGEAP